MASRQAQHSQFVFRWMATLAIVGFAAAPGATLAGENHVCNEGDKAIVYAAAREWQDGPSLSCELLQTHCYVELQGWYILKPGQCHELMVGLKGTTYLSLFIEGDDGALSPAAYKPANPESSGALSGAYLCLPDTKFHVRLAGTLEQGFAASKQCVAGASLATVNVWMRTEPDKTFTLRLE